MMMVLRCSSCLVLLLDELLQMLDGNIGREGVVMAGDGGEAGGLPSCMMVRAGRLDAALEKPAMRPAR